MNSSSKVPPRFVPTLTEVVPVEDAVESAQAAPTLDQALAKVEQSLSVAEASEAAQSAAQSAAVVAPLASFHSPWLADGLYMRGKPAGISHDLPPLPESLPPQQPFADASVELPLNEVIVSDAALQEYEEDLQAEVAVPLAISDEMQPAEVVPEAAAIDEAQPHSMPTPVDMAAVEERLVQRLMEHVDQVLETRLSDAIAAVLQQQTQTLVQRLREEVEAAVRHTVSDAVKNAQAQPQDLGSAEDEV